MAIMMGRDGVLGDLRAETDRLRRLLADLEALADGALPSRERLAAAPRLEGWRAGVRPTSCLVGSCTDHPLLNGPVIWTSEVWVVAPALGWARTCSRFYRLGAPDPAEDLDRDGM